MPNFLEFLAYLCPQNKLKPMADGEITGMLSSYEKAQDPSWHTYGLQDWWSVSLTSSSTETHQPKIPAFWPITNALEKKETKF